MVDVHGALITADRDVAEVAGFDVAGGEASTVAHHLALRSLAAIEQEGVPLPLKGDRSNVAAHRGSRSGGAEESDSNHTPSRWEADRGLGAG